MASPEPTGDSPEPAPEAGDTLTTARAYIHAYESSRRSGARSERLEAMYGSAMEAATRSEAQPAMAENGRKADRRDSTALVEVAR